MANTAQHTPGPWAVENGLVTGVDSSLGSPPGTPSFDIFDAANWPESLEDEALANARLIAAAPELLEACKSAIASIEQLVLLNRIPANNKGLRECKAAIAKATGEV